jgi:hypothetical protein
MLGARRLVAEAPLELDKGAREIAGSQSWRPSAVVHDMFYHEFPLTIGENRPLFRTFRICVVFAQHSFEKVFSEAVGRRRDYCILDLVR